MKKLVFLLGLATFSSACSKMSFTPVQMNNQKLDGPEVTDPVPPPPVVDPLPVRKTGVCSDQQSLTSCLKCEVPVVTPPPPTVSTKAEKLAKIMSMACQIYNKSYPSNYVAPTADEVKAHLLACSPELYPETPMTSAQVNTMGQLLDESSDSMRQRLFKGLWYQPPYSDDFELYFGLSGAEAAYAICMNNGSVTGPLMTSEYSKALYMDGGYDQWLRDPAAQARWQAAQQIRQQLISCFNKPGQPWVSPSQPPAVNPKTCDYRTFEGKYEQGGREEIQNALAEGYKLAIETDNACVQVNQVPGVNDFHGNLKIAGYRCQ